MGKDRVQREFNPPCIGLAVDVVHLLQLTPGFVQGDVRVLSSQSLNMFELKRVMMYLYWLEEHNRQGLSLSLSVSTLLPRPQAQPPPNPLPPPVQLTPEFTDLLAFCSCPLHLRSEEHSIHHLLLSGVEQHHINLDQKIHTHNNKKHEKVSSQFTQTSSPATN